MSSVGPHQSRPHPQRIDALDIRRRIGREACHERGIHAAQRIVAARASAVFTGTEELALRAELDSADLNALAAADALASLSGHRRLIAKRLKDMTPVLGELATHSREFH